MLLPKWKGIHIDIEMTMEKWKSLLGLQPLDATPLLQPAAGSRDGGTYVCYRALLCAHVDVTACGGGGGHLCGATRRCVWGGVA